MRVLVTGAGGFVGRRLVAALAEQGASVRSFVRRPLAGAMGEIAIGDVTAPETLAAATAGCEVVVHCAHGGGDAAECHRINALGTAHVLAAAAAAGVRRVVHLSTWRVHGRRLPADVHEDLPVVSRGNPYDVSKARAEALAFDCARRRGVELVVLRPTIVYGPSCGPWVETLVERMKYERLRLIDGGRCPANVVHVDDLVAAIQQAMTVAAAAGDAYLISGAPVPTWREYLRPLCAALGKPLPPSLPRWAARALAPAAPWHYRFTRRWPALLPADLGLFVDRCTVRIDKARRRLGYEPRLDLAAGMAGVVAQLRADGWVGAAVG